MKRIWHHPEPLKTGRRYWRSIAEHENAPEFQEGLGREFDPSLEGMTEDERENSRRDFMKMMGGAAALSGLSLVSCRRPLAKVVPFAKHVEWMIPGKPLLYTTTIPRAWGATPVVVTTHEGRPTHLQANSLHPLAGGLDIFAQASVLDLYNPDRVKTLSFRKELGEVVEVEGADGFKKEGPNAGEVADWARFQAQLADWSKAWAASGGEGLGLLFNESASPTQARLLGELKKALPKVKAYSYEPVRRSSAAVAAKTLLGDGIKLLPQLGKADIVFSLDCDFLGLDPQSENGIRDFMKNRAPGKASDKMNRLYVIENRYTLTGGVSDHRKPLAASLIPLATAVLADEIGKLTGDSALSQSALSLVSAAPADIRPWIAMAAKDLFANKGKSLVLAGSTYGEAVHALVIGINNALNSFGSTVDILKVEPQTNGTIEELQADLKAKSLKNLFVLTETDPAFDAIGFTGALKDSGAELVYLAQSDNLTAKFSKWTLPAAHYLESWGDARSSDGTYAIVQPMIQPLFGGVSANEILLVLAGKKELAPKKVVAAPNATPAPAVSDIAYESVKETFKGIAGGWDEEKWNVTLRDGFLAKSGYEKASATVNGGVIAGLVKKVQPTIAPDKDSFEVVFTPDATVWDGRYSENPWLQEAPDPITKLTWDNAAWLSPKTFRALGLKSHRYENSTIKVTVGGKTLEVAALECPGHAHNSITLPIGYGQKQANIVGKERGFDVNPLRSSAVDFVLTGAKVEATANLYEFAITQDNYTMEARAQVREGTQERFAKNEKFAATEGMDSHIPPTNLALYKGRVGKKQDKNPEAEDYNPEGFDYENNHQWGMVIDLAKCIGCSACIVACQSENNIAIVGKDQVRRGRVMHWIRMDRYFATTDSVDTDPGLNELENPEMVHQPVACQQCESAPCETVCPVNATVHTEDGLNAMAYNRCIGTRYCANNCPFTARRFNYFDYNKRNPLIETELPLVGKVRNLYAGPLGEKNPQEMVQLQKNPNVTVRMRGVIEKCTYCVQRLEAAKINQRRAARDDASKLRIAADAVKTACQASCPAEAIMFGDLANEKSTVNIWKENPRNYQVLKYLGIRPRTSYLARIRNVNPEMASVETDRVRKTGEASLYNF